MLPTLSSREIPIPICYDEHPLLRTEATEDAATCQSTVAFIPCSPHVIAIRYEILYYRELWQLLGYANCFIFFPLFVRLGPNASTSSTLDKCHQRAIITLHTVIFQLLSIRRVDIKLLGCSGLSHLDSRFQYTRHDSRNSGRHVKSTRHWRQGSFCGSYALGGECSLRHRYCPKALHQALCEWADWTR